MSYCINPNCQNRQNPDDVEYCQACNTQLLINERYRLVQPLRELHKSPYVEVFEVEDCTTLREQGTSKVLKILKDNNDTLVRLFEREAQVLSWLRHPGIPKVEPDGYFTFSPSPSTTELRCLVMEKVVGEDLQQWLKQNGSIPDQNLALEWLRRLTEILHQVHQNGIFHRDIKPSNIMLRPNGQLVLIDFGAARQVTQTVIERREVTGVYSYGYTAPEQVEGKGMPQSDFFALGRTFIHLLTGQHPGYFSKNSQIGQLIWQDSAPQISQRLADFIDQLMAPSWEKRPQDTQEILKRTEQIILQRTVQRLKEIGTFPQMPPGEQENPEHSGSIIPVSAKAEEFHPRSVLSPEETAGSATHSTPLVDTAASKSKLRGKSNVFLFPKSPQLLIGGGIVLALATGIYCLQWLPNSPIVQEVAPPIVKVPEFSLARTLSGHSDSVWSVAISPSEQTLVSGSEDKTIKVWNLQTGQLSRTLSGHDDTVRSITLSPDGQILASGSGDKTVKLWNLKTGELIRTLSGHASPVWSVAISRDGQTLVSGSEANTKIWDLQTGELRRILFGHSGRVFSVALSPDGQAIATGSIDKTIKLWNLQTGELLHTLAGHSDAVRSVSFSPDGQQLASSSWDKTIKVWNLQTGELLHTLAGHSAQVVSVAFNADGHTLASAGLDKTIKIWDLQTGELRRTLSGHSDWVLSVAARPTLREGQSPTGQTLVSSSKDKTIKIWQR